jgi:hypothetical protein
MPTMDWEAFQESHHRPHLVLVDLPRTTVSRSQAARLSKLQQLAEQLQIIGPYAMRAEQKSILIAFELDTDAQRFGNALSARPGTRDAAWASKFHCRLDRTAQRRISDSLRAARLRLAKRPPIG